MSVELLFVPDPTEAPVVDPTESPVADPTEAPVVDPTEAPVVDPTEAPVVDPNEGCLCDKDDESLQSWKCGNDVYICPGVERLCSVQPSQNPDFYRITQDECDEMKKVEIGEKCIPLPDQNVNQPKGLSNRVCYSNTEGTNGFNGMKEDGSCDVCNDSVLTSELIDNEEIPVVDPTEAPVVDPTEAPVVDPTEAPIVEAN